ncbi:MAG: hypothetical protein CW338_03980 [Clostridiales bacterium]|nr:hypothetical protein [Clostridiales bacterium]
MKRLSLILVTAILLANICLPCALAEDELSVERHFAAPCGYSRSIVLPTGRTVYYYAQNDELWCNLYYESGDSSRRRTFGDSGCGPSSTAMALRQVLTEEELAAFLKYLKHDCSLCACSLNKVRCNKSHIRYYITSAADVAKFLPLLIADFACGNNTFGVVSRSEETGTNMTYYNVLHDMFGVEVTKTTRFSEAEDAVNRGCGVVIFTAAGGPFTNTGHYMYLADADDEFVYVLDPLCRTSYSATDSKHIVHVLDTGLVGIRREDLRYAEFWSYTILSGPGQLTGGE